MKHIAHVLRQLQWKLTFSYTVITCVAVLLIELLTVLVVLGYFLFNQSSVLAGSLQVQATQAIPYFVHNTPDRAALTKWLRIMASAAPGATDLDQRGFLCVVDHQGRVVAALGKNAPPLDGALQAPYLAAPMQEILRGERTVVTMQEKNGLMLVIAPIQEAQKQPIGALITQTTPLNVIEVVASSGRLLPIVVVNVLLLTLLVGIMGSIFGFLTARGFTRRFKRLSFVADHWSRGDFSVLAWDESRDELGQLARNLNLMAEQLQRLLQTQQQLATLEERNRLARDLHDSVKQQIFSVAMQIGTLRVLLKRDGEKALLRLDEMERTIRTTQQELTSLIQELRPAALNGKDLGKALQELLTQWASQIWISASVVVEGACDLSPMVEDALFRLLQEALSNVARHSNATEVRVRLSCEGETVTLLLSDNGQGFDVMKKEGHGVGLLSMRERAQAVGGTMKIESEAGTGTQIRICCPAHSVPVLNAH
ncbi:MAG TPA: histidine kinase, partial [Ktedonobacteraceae bacterium]|jgi:NarL family two-component system sensor histidine kinase LiaS